MTNIEVMVVYVMFCIVISVNVYTTWQSQSQVSLTLTWWAVTSRLIIFIIASSRSRDRFGDGHQWSIETNLVFPDTKGQSSSGGILKCQPKTNKVPWNFTMLTQYDERTFYRLGKYYLYLNLKWSKTIKYK